MAINLNCNLNGGDSVTPNNELFYRIYGSVDNYASPIHTTGTGVADANVTVTNDVVVITNVDGTTNTSFKIAAVDESGNEGILSDAKSGIILFEDTFQGTTLSTAKWSEEETTVNGEYSVNNRLVFTDLVDIQAGAGTIRLSTEGKFEFDSTGETTVLIINVDQSGLTVNKDASRHIALSNADLSNRVSISYDSSTPYTQARLLTVNGGSATSTLTGEDYQSSFKYVMTGGTVNIYKWGGSDWGSSLGSSSYTDDVYHLFIQRDTKFYTGGTQEWDIARVFVLNEDIDTETP